MALDDGSLDSPKVVCFGFVPSVRGIFREAIEQSPGRATDRFIPIQTVFAQVVTSQV